MRKPVLLILTILLSLGLFAQDSIPSTPLKEKKKKGWTFGALPVVAYDADLGFQYGVLGQVFNYGDGSTYPEYKHTIYAEVSRFTKGSGVNQIFYDSKYLIPHQIRITAEVSYLTEQALDFYGFNGYEATYVKDYTVQESDEYISRVFYKYKRDMLRVLADFQGPILGNKLRWYAGFNFFGIKVATVDVDRINKGKKESKQLPDTTLLYDDYVDFGIIGPEEKFGNNLYLLKAGLIFDTRDNEAAPNTGMWAEALIITAPKFMGNRQYSFATLALTYRQYITVVPKAVVFAYRLAYQGTIAGDQPFYFLPYMFTSFALTTKPDGLGGSRTIRGVLRNRVIGDGVAYGNIELRYKFWKTFLFKQNFYLAALGFFDAGMVVQDHPVDRDLVPAGEQSFYFDQTHDALHMGTGLGLRAALNENFIIAVDYGFALDKRDGSSGLYIGVSHIF
jgi:hypothetical protein